MIQGFLKKIARKITKNYLKNEHSGRLSDCIGSGSIAREKILDLIKHNCPFVSVHDGQHVFLFDSRDNCMLNEFFLRGSFESSMLNDFFALASKFYPGRKGIFFEAGGNIGTASIKMLSYSQVTKVIACEPSSVNCNLFKINKILNNIPDDAIELVKVGLSNQITKMDLEICTENFGDCRIRTNTKVNVNRYSENIRKTEEVDVITLDSYISKRGIKESDIGFVWLDTQGFEGFILEGAKTIVGNDIPLIIEFWPYGTKRSDNFDLLLKILKGHYKYFISMQEYAQGKEILHEINELDDFAKKITQADDLAYNDLFLIKDKK